jgi:hypothetical protein
VDTFKGMFSGESARAEDPSLSVGVVFEAEDEEELELLDNNDSLVVAHNRTEAELSQAAYHAQFMSNRFDGELEEEKGDAGSSSGSKQASGKDDQPNDATERGTPRDNLTEQEVEDLDLKAKIAARSLEDAKAAAVAEAQAEKEAREEAAKANAAANDAKVADAILTFLRRSGVNVLKVLMAMNFQTQNLPFLVSRLYGQSCACPCSFVHPFFFTPSSIFFSIMYVHAPTGGQRRPCAPHEDNPHGRWGILALEESPKALAQSLGALSVREPRHDQTSKPQLCSSEPKLLLSAHQHQRPIRAAVPVVDLRRRHQVPGFGAFAFESTEPHVERFAAQGGCASLERRNFGGGASVAARSGKACRHSESRTSAVALHSRTVCRSRRRSIRSG